MAASALAALGVALALVSVRGEVHSEAIALVLAVTVAVAGRVGSRAGGIAAALMAAAAFNFFHTEPYLSLKIADSDDILTTILLLVVGLVVGGLSARADASNRGPDGAVTRVLTVAMEGDHDDVEMSVRAELIEVLHLRRCWFATEPLDLPALERSGSVLPGDGVVDLGGRPGPSLRPPRLHPRPGDRRERRRPAGRHRAGGGARAQPRRGRTVGRVGVVSSLKRILVGQADRQHRGAAPAPRHPDRAGRLRLRRHLVDRVRDRGDPGRPPRRDRASRTRTATSCPSPSRRSSCWRSWPRATGRRSSPTPTAAAPTSCPARTSRPTVALVAGASLLVDYTLTVAVSISSGVLAISSAVPALRPEGYRILLCLGFLILLTLGNLRGVKESGRLFAVPTYAYVVLLFSMLIYGLVRVFGFHLGPIPGGAEAAQEFAHGKQLTSSIALFALLKAFSSGAVVLSGVEAISNGVPAFKKPESKHAARTLGLMALILGAGFMGISVLAHHLLPVVQEDGETVLSQMAKAVFGAGNPLYYALQIATFAILVLAANTAYADFPRLSSIIARDRYLPRQLANRGDRLVFSNGILSLAGFAAVLIIAFRAEVTLLIPLYAVGVFTGFTLVAVRDVPSPPHAAGTELAARAGHQRDRLRRHRHRADRGRRVEVHRRRVDPRRRDPADRPRLPVDPQALRPGRQRAPGARCVQGAAADPHRRRAGRSGAQGRARGARLRPLPPPRPPPRGLRGVERRGAGADRRRVGAPGHRRSSSGPCTRPTGS